MARRVGWIFTGNEDIQDKIMSNVRLFSKEPPRAWRLGFVNNANDCYRNSIFASIFTLPRFVNFLLYHAKLHWNDPAIDCDNQGLGCGPCQLAHFAQYYWHHPYHRAEPGQNERNQLDIFAAAYQDFMDDAPSLTQSDFVLNPNLQQDASEFFNEIILNWGFDDISDPAPPEHMKLSLFTYHVKEESRCPSCGQAVQNQQVVQSAVDLRPSQGTPYTSLDEALEAVMTSDQRTQTCPNPQCAKQLQFDWCTRFETAPEYLVVKLNYFSYNTKTQAPEKLPLEYRIQTSLDIARLVEPGRQNLGIEPLTDHMLYDLKAVVAHAGDDTTSGHYITYVNHPTAAGTRTWYTINDEDVSRCGVSAAKFPAWVEGQTDAAGDPFQPYMLFFERTSRSATKSRYTPAPARWRAKWSPAAAAATPTQPTKPTTRAAAKRKAATRKAAPKGAGATKAGGAATVSPVLQQVARTRIVKMTPTPPKKKAAGA